MSEFSLPSQSQFILEMQRLHAAQLAAGTPEERDLADYEMSLFLRYSATGRLQEYFDRKASV